MFKIGDLVYVSDSDRGSSFVGTILDIEIPPSQTCSEDKTYTVTDRIFRPMVGKYNDRVMSIAEIKLLNILYGGE